MIHTQVQTFVVQQVAHMMAVLTQIRLHQQQLQLVLIQVEGKQVHRPQHQLPRLQLQPTQCLVEVAGVKIHA